ncbi:MULTISPECIES: MCE family protein [Streptomyces]|uniref:MCE family protein n=1 Tax=Streptomyces edwardsiae TaxID=3075527 RepID=A0ABU2PNX4_9ACTN|nr:MCE family protein [Streptomyces sp. DSM 41636]MDT0393878.1 MCE family protein [Streptomyces sp. DSM 41636]
MRRPHIKPVKERNPVAVGVVGLVLITLIGLLAYHVDRLPFGGGTTYSADFSEAAGLGEGDEVRIAGVKVGKVTGVALDGAKVKVTFEVEDAWLGDRTTAAIAIKTVLGDKYLALDPLGSGRQDPGSRIPLTRTTSPYDVTQAFQDLSGTVDDIDTRRLAESFETISDTFENSPPHVRKAATGLSDLSKTISKRDAKLAELLKGSATFTKTLENNKSGFETLIEDSGPLLGELRDRRSAIRALLKGSRDLGSELGGLVEDNEKQLGPTLKALGRVTTVLEKNNTQLGRTLALVGPYYRLVGNTVGNGRWFDSYLCGVVPRDYLPAASRPETGCLPPKQPATAQGSGE